MDLATLLAEHRSQAVLGLALLLGAAFGALVQWKGFCLLRALRDSRLQGQHGALGRFVLAMLCALAVTQGLAVWLGLPLEQAVYAQPRLSLGLIVGGLLFGAGMTLANACGARSLVLLGGGNLRALVTLLCMAVAAGATMSGVLSSWRIWLGDIGIDLPAGTLPAWLAHAGLTTPLARLLPTLIAAVALGLLAWRLMRSGPHPTRSDSHRTAPSAGIDPTNVSHRRNALAEGTAAVLIGLTIALGWLVTGHIGADDFEPIPVASLSFVAPVSDGMRYLQLSTGIPAGFGAALVAGVVLGAFLFSALAGQLRWQGFDSVGQLQRSTAGGILMGIGGVMALGCSIGQGLSGISTLSLATFVAFPAILLGSLLAMPRRSLGA